MSTETIDKRRSTRHGFWFWIFVGGLAGALLAGTVATATVAAAPAIAARAFGHRFSGHGPQDLEAMQERAELATAFILGRVDATDEQQAEVKRIVSDTLGNLQPLAEQHRAQREAFQIELGRDTIDPVAIEQLRQSGMALADSASLELSEAITALAQTLSAEQRAELMDMAHRFHR